MPHTTFHRLRDLIILGGFMDGTRIEFAPNLNCLIGARGTGKTTVLEFVRYALDEIPDDTTYQKKIKSLIERNLASGRVELGIETKDGLTYIISRAAGEEPVVLTSDRKPTDITLKAGSFFKADIFSQNEMESIADQSLSQLDLIDTFEADQIAEFGTQLKQLTMELSANASAITPVKEKIAALDETLAELPGVEEKLKGLSAGGGNNAVEINQAHAEKSLRDRETRAVKSLGEFLKQYYRDITPLVGKLDSAVENALSREMLVGPHAEVFGELRSNFTACASMIDELLRKAQEAIKLEHGKLTESNSKLTVVHAEEEMAFRALIEKHQAAMGQETERAKLEKRRNDLLAMTRQREEQAAALDKLQSERSALSQKLSEVRDARFQVRRAVAERINSALQPTIRVTITQDGNPQRYQALLEEMLKGASIKIGPVAEKIVQSMWPADLFRIVLAEDAQQLVDTAELNATQASKVIVTLLNSDLLYNLETVELIDQPKIELNDNGTYKDSTALSTGQKCTTILPILLLESLKPLLIDQPEDNLDNRFISQTVVDSLRKVKTKRQLIFVTHNPNIPVLGDAERVIVLESNGVSARMIKHGNVDECKENIVTLLEGGEDAFKQRKTRYNY